MHIKTHSKICIWNYPKCLYALFVTLKKKPTLKKWVGNKGKGFNIITFLSNSKW